MKHNIVLLLFLTGCFYTNAQLNTEVFLYDLEVNNSKIEIKNGKNISNNNGYDNQPSFYDNDNIIFASTRNGQTDIANYNILKDSIVYINSSEGGEYTPLKIPKKNKISAVRLDPDNKQRLYSYDIKKGESKELIKDLVVAYYTWFDENIVISAVIEGEQLHLYRTNINTGISKKLASNVGRSFHKIPNSNLVSFISKSNDKQWQIKSLNPVTGKIRLIANTIANIEDICWLNKTNLLSSKGSELYKLTLRVDNNWIKVTDLYDAGISNITRLATNDEGSKLLVTGDIKTNPNANQVSKPAIDKSQPITEEEAAKVAEKRIEPFNQQQLSGFVDVFDDEIEVYVFPNEKLYEGKAQLEETYKKVFNEHEKLNVKVLNRITYKNFVIDEELALINTSTRRQATIYETDYDGINRMTLLSNSTATDNPETIVNNQLEKYNKRDLKGFTKTYSKNIEIYNFPNELIIEGRSNLKDSYESLFNDNPDLNAEIVNRIILGNMVIDKEKVTMNGQLFYAIAIYEIENGLITKVTFIQ